MLSQHCLKYGQFRSSPFCAHAMKTEIHGVFLRHLYYFHQIEDIISRVHKVYQIHYQTPQ